MALKGFAAILLMAVMAAVVLCASSNCANAHVLNTPQKMVKDPSLECSLCQVVVSFVDKEIEGNASQAEIVKILDEVCLIFSAYPSLHKECINFLSDWGEALSYIIEEESSVTQICNGFAFCRINDTVPYFPHVALTGNVNTMSVTWMTYAVTNQTIAKWSLTPGGPIVGTATGTYSYYYAPGGYWHSVLLTDLKPFTKYFYTVGSNAGWSEEQSFITAPATSQNFSIAIYGDMGVHNSEGTTAQVKRIAKAGLVNWIYHIGDISYGDDYPGNIYEYIWNQWFASMTDVTSLLPYQTCPGNHEYNCQHPLCAPYSGNFAAYNHRFRMPGAESGSNTNMFFSFDYSYAHFVSISSETDYPAAPYPSKFGNQLAWLENDLQKAYAARTPQRPWIIVVGHRPLYSSNAQEGGVPNDYAVHLQSAVEALFLKYKVDIYFSGHVHSYERLYAIAQNKVVSTNYVNPTGPAYVVSGAAGCIEGLQNFPKSIPVWSANRYNATEGYGILDVSPTTLAWKFYRSTDNGLQDSFTLVKTHL